MTRRRPGLVIFQCHGHTMLSVTCVCPGPPTAQFTTFDFIPGIPAPFNFGLAILMNQKMLTLPEKIQTAPPLLPVP